MYYDYFGLKQPPFKITPDTNLFFPGGERGAILDALVFAVTNGEGIIKVVGEVGSGKTMLCRMLQKELPASVEIVYLANPSVSPENILHAIAFELKLPVEADSSKLLVMHQIQEYLLEKHSNNQQVVVFVEEAQGMPLATMEEIRLLSNLETNQNKLLQIILFGQPELDQMIGQRNIRQLRERITYSFQLNPFKSNDINEYINTRLRSCGFRAGELFTDSAIRSISRYSNGLVRRINILADKSMLAAYAANTNRITAKHVGQAARDSEFITGRWRYWLPSSVVLVLLIAYVAYWRTQGEVPDRLSAAEQSTPDGLPGAQPVAAAIPVSADQPAAVKERAVRSPSVDSIIEETPFAAQEEPLGEDETLGETSKKKVVLQLSDSLADGRSQEIPQASFTQGSGPDPAVPGAVHNDMGEISLQAVREQEGFEGQLIGLNDVFRLQDEGDARLTDQERIILRQQLKVLPPEEAVSLDASLTGDECKLCWSIIYRPLIESGNL